MAGQDQQLQDALSQLSRARGQTVVGTLPMDTYGVLADRARKGQRVHVIGALVYGNSGVAYLAVSDTGESLLVSSNVIHLTWPDRPAS